MPRGMSKQEPEWVLVPPYPPRASENSNLILTIAVRALRIHGSHTSKLLNRTKETWFGWVPWRSSFLEIFLCHQNLDSVNEWPARPKLVIWSFWNNSEIWKPQFGQVTPRRAQLLHHHHRRLINCRCNVLGGLLGSSRSQLEWYQENLVTSISHLRSIIFTITTGTWNSIQLIRSFI